ncbi:MAG: D-alanyl-D-alanine carboxypeptidase family protein, partial [Pseudomonadota bacterium]
MNACRCTFRRVFAPRTVGCCDNAVATEVLKDHMYAPFRRSNALPRRLFGLAAPLLGLLAVLFYSLPAEANPKYAGYVYDVVSGKTLYSENADAQRFPASLTKIMTVYIMFEEIKAGRLHFGTRMRVSKYAAGRPPSKIGLRVGGSIKVRDAIKALVTKSANDVSVVVAEHISGSEAAFARRMTKTARRLGMKSTTFRNANGLPNSGQVTTARDMVKLGIAVQRDFPQYYGVFQTRTFRYGKRNYRNHNKLLGTVTGVDGIKTGYIRASGFNLVTSVTVPSSLLWLRYGDRLHNAPGSRLHHIDHIRQDDGLRDRMGDGCDREPAAQGASARYPRDAGILGDR